MIKKSVFLFLLAGVLLISGVDALSVSNSSVNSSLRTVSIADVTELYAYEVNFEFSGSVSVTTSDFFDFLQNEGDPTTKGSDEKGTALSVYESILNSTSIGVNGTGDLFNVTHTGDLTMENAVLIFLNGSEMTINFSSGDVVVTPPTNPNGGGGGGGGGVDFPGGDVYAPGQDVVAEIEVDNFGRKRGFDFNLHYAIKDFEGNTLAYAEENIAIETKVELVRELTIPRDAVPGDYVFVATASHEGAKAFGSKGFKVEGVALSPFTTGSVFIIILSIAALVALIVTVVVVLHSKGKKKTKDMSSQFKD
jgi:hypothetical protein